jgi:hypothetical protein
MMSILTISLYGKYGDVNIIFTLSSEKECLKDKKSKFNY